MENKNKNNQIFKFTEKPASFLVKNQPSLKTNHKSLNNYLKYIFKVFTRFNMCTNERTKMIEKINKELDILNKDGFRELRNQLEKMELPELAYYYQRLKEKPKIYNHLGIIPIKKKNHHFRYFIFNKIKNSFN